MTPGDLIIKDPQADRPYGFNWEAFLAALGPTVEIATSQIIVSGSEGSPVPLAVHDAVIVTGNLRTFAYYAEGTNGKKYKITNRIVTNTVPPVTDDRSVYMLVSPR